MAGKHLMTVALMASVAAVPGTRAAADFGSGLVGGLVGGAVSGLIVNEGAKSRSRTTRKVYRAPSNSVSRQQVREEQTALNYFGFPAGTPDGVRGRNTRNAVSQFQAHMGYPVTGTLQPYERQFLISAHYRAQSGGMATSQLIAQRGQGTRGLLHAYRDQATGVPQGQSPVMAAVPQQARTETASAPEAAPEPEPETRQASATALPNLMGSGGDGPSLASHCNQVSLVTNSNGGFVTPASMQDGRIALNEQFCIARTYAIAEGETMSAALTGITPDQLEEQCRAFGPAMRDHVAALSMEKRDAVLTGVRSFVMQSGQAPAQLAGTAKICLSVGYRIDNMTVALGSGLLLTALGQEAYGELMGHHLNEGFGTTRRPDLALDWFKAAVDAVEGGAEPVFAPGNPDRNTLLRKAVFGGAESSRGSRVQPAATLPTFDVD